MLELAARLMPLLAAGQRIAVATSIDVIGSTPHRAGTSMAVTADAVLGSVSNGCVESAALADCRALLAGAPPVVRRYGFGDAEAVAAGLSCGGELDVVVHALGPEALPALEAAAGGETAWLAVVTGGPALGRVIGPAALSAFAAETGIPEARLRAAIEGRMTSGGLDLDCHGVPLRLFVDVAASARRMVVVGATDTAAELARAATAIGYAVTVCDPRAALVPAGRFAPATVVVGLPHRIVAAAGLGPRDAVCLLSHDEDLDPLALAVALESPAGYVGALGSRATAARRRERMLALGVWEAVIDRLHAPIGLDVGASTPAEIAVSILAEVLVTRAAASGDPLCTRTGPVHAPSRATEPVRVSSAPQASR